MKDNITKFTVAQRHKGRINEYQPKLKTEYIAWVRDDFINLHPQLHFVSVDFEIVHVHSFRICFLFCFHRILVPYSYIQDEQIL